MKLWLGSRGIYLKSKQLSAKPSIMKHMCLSGTQPKPL